MSVKTAYHATLAALYAAALGYRALLWTLAGVATVAALFAYRAERQAAASIP